MTSRPSPRNSPSTANSGRTILLSAVLSLLILMLGAGAYFGLASLREPPSARETAERRYNVEVFEVRRSDLQEIVSGFGTARAEREVVVNAQVAGEIVEVHPQLDVGRQVRPADVQVGPAGESQRTGGDLLLRIDPEAYRQRVRQAEQRIAEVRAQLDRLSQEQENNEELLEQAREDVRVYREEYDRIQTLYDRGVATESQATEARLQLQQYESTLLKARNEQKLFPLREEQLRRQLESLQTELETARLDLEKTRIRPPFAGTLSEIMVERGQYVQPGEPLVRLTDNSSMEIPVPVTLEDYAKIEPMLQAERYPRVDLAEHETAPARWRGHLVRAAPKADELTRTIEVYVHVENGQQPVPLLPGTFVHARMAGPVLEDVRVIPREAIRNGRVFVAEDGRATAHRVEVKRTLQTLAVLESDGGIREGAQVILTNLDGLHDGARVQVASHHGLSDELEEQRTPRLRPVLARDGEEASADPGESGG